MDDTSFLAILQLADSFFPSGMVTLSHGLETFIGEQPQPQRDIPQLLENYLSSKVTPLELVAYAQAYRATEATDLTRLHRIDRHLTASLLPAELRQASTRSGRALLETVSPFIDSSFLHSYVRGVKRGESSGNAPISFAIACALWQTPQRVGGLAFLYTFAVSFLGAAVRLGCIGHREAQRILLTLRPRLPALVDQALRRELEEMSAFAPLADIRAMQHAYLPVRLFSS